MRSLSTWALSSRRESQTKEGLAFPEAQEAVRPGPLEG